MDRFLIMEPVFFFMRRHVIVSARQSCTGHFDAAADALVIPTERREWRDLPAMVADCYLEILKLFS